MNQRRRTLNAMKNDHYAFMRLAMKAAEKARGTCSPNPFVGAVLVNKGKVIATGWTQPYGGDHAEVQALMKAGSEATGSDLYVTLEPCSHYGKTPPCTLSIISAGVSRVFYGITDPNPLVNGNGCRQLEEAGIEVRSGVCASDIERQLEYYLCRINNKRPFVTWKAALSLDGKYAANDGSSQWISGVSSRKLAHQLRQESDVVLTGIGTVLCDDPMLNVRLPRVKKHPLRAILDARLQLPLESKLCKTGDAFPTAVFCDKESDRSEKASLLRDGGINVVPVSTMGDKLDLSEILNYLHNQGKYSVLLECGSALAASFWEKRLIDKAHIFYGAMILGGNKAILGDLELTSISDAIGLRIAKCRQVGQDVHIVAYPDYHL